MNHYSTISPTELVVSMFHPKMNELYHKFKNLMDLTLKKRMDANALKLYEYLSEVSKGVSRDGFVLVCESAGLSEGLIDTLTTMYDKYINLDGDDLAAAFNRFKNYALSEGIKYSVQSYNVHGDPARMIEELDKLKVNGINNKFNEPEMYSRKRLSEIDVNKVLDEVTGRVIHSSFDVINNSTPLKGYVRGQAFVISAPTGGGKSLAAMQESIHFAKQGLHVNYSAFGDLKDYHFIVRLTSMITGYPFAFVEMNLSTSVEKAKQLAPEVFENLCIELLAPAQFSADTYVRHLKDSEQPGTGQSMYEWADVIIVDYDSNIDSEHTMYLKGEDIYQSLYQLTYPDKLLLILSQPVKSAWFKEIIPLSDLGESSRKQQILDGVLTISHPPAYNSKNHVGWINLCKGRGVELLKSPYFRDQNGRFFTIDEGTYALIKASSDAKTFIEDNRLFEYSADQYDLLGKPSASTVVSSTQDNLVTEDIIKDITDGVIDE